MAVAIKAFVWIVGILVVGFFGWIFEARWASGEFDGVPREHDPRLVGRWVATPQAVWMVAIANDTHQPLKTATYELRADGTGNMSNRGSFEWGTQDGKLQMKYLAVDAWSRPTFAYEVSADGKKITLDKKTHMLFGPVWTRQ